MNIKRMLQTIHYGVLFNSVSRGRYISKKHIFGHIGSNVRLPFMLIPLHAENIFIHNNVEVASGVKFVVHDAIHSVFNGIPGNRHRYRENIGKIEIMDNVFIGANSVILPDVKIGPNAVVAAGAVVNKDVPCGTVVGGVPAKVIGSFDELRKKRG